MNYLEISNLDSVPYEVDEAINRLHINLLFCGTDYKKIMITSSVPDEGKSVVSILLWKKIAESGKTVAYLDADLRKSVIKSRYKFKFDISNPLGFSHYLSGQATINEVMYKTNIPNAYMLPVLRNISNPGLLLHNEKFERTLDELSHKLDYIIVDTPPLDTVADGELIASKCDGSILVVRNGVTPKSIIASSIKQLGRANCRLLGVVLNRAVTGKGQYYYKNKSYSYYSKYYTDSK